MAMHTVDVIPAALRFGRCELSPHHRELRVDGKAVRLGGRAFDILLVLVEDRGKVVTKDEIFDRVWPGVIVEENTLQVQISAVRKAMGSDRDLVKTISGRGYRFTGDLTTAGAEATADRRETEIPEGLDSRTAHRLATLIGAAIELAAAHHLPAFGIEELAHRLDDRRAQTASNNFRSNQALPKESPAHSA